jgi:hypothetical protein
VLFDKADVSFSNTPLTKENAERKPSFQGKYSKESEESKKGKKKFFLKSEAKDKILVFPTGSSPKISMQLAMVILTGHKFRRRG